MLMIQKMGTPSLDAYQPLDDGLEALDYGPIATSGGEDGYESYGLEEVYSAAKVTRDS